MFNKNLKARIEKIEQKLFEIENPIKFQINELAYCIEWYSNIKCDIYEVFLVNDYLISRKNNKKTFGNSFERFWHGIREDYSENNLKTLDEIKDLITNNKNVKFLFFTEIPETSSKISELEKLLK